MYIEEQISKNKAILIQLDWWKPYIDKLYAYRLTIWDYNNWFFCHLSLLGIININLHWNKKRDHAGFYFDINIFGLNFIFNIYDNRHWDDDNDKWAVYEIE